MMTLNEILTEEYEKTLGALLDPNALLRLIEEIMEAPTAMAEEVATPQGVQFEPQEMLLKMIPDIAVSEIGWSDVRTVELEDGAATEISGPQRALLQDYLANIGGTTFEERIARISRFYTDGSELISEEAEDRTQKLVKAISYLVFYKTLTKVITNFNASSAGFSFESFLATLVNGRQIPANTGTIADYVDRATDVEIPVSLKLYKEGQLEVGGSYNALVKDLVDPQWPQFGNRMRYVVCTKTLEGDDLEQEGQIDFYQFDFTLENVLDILVNSKDRSSQCIMLPRSIVSELEGGKQSGVDINRSLPGQQNLPSDEDLEQGFLGALKDKLQHKDVPLSQMQLGALGELLSWAKKDDLFQNFIAKKGDEKVDMGIVRGRSKLNKVVVQRLIDSLDWTADLKLSDGRKLRKDGLATIVVAANNVVIDTMSKSRLADERRIAISNMVKEGEFLSPEESARVYKTFGVIQRRIALINSWGYLTNAHFSLNNTQSLNPDAPTNTVELGSIKVGSKYVAIALNNVRELLNKEVYEIFQSLKILSDSLNAFFAGGLREDTLATTAVDNAQNIQSKEILQPDE